MKVHIPIQWNIYPIWPWGNHIGPICKVTVYTATVCISNLKNVHVSWFSNYSFAYTYIYTNICLCTNTQYIYKRISSYTYIIFLIYIYQYVSHMCVCVCVYTLYIHWITEKARDFQKYIYFSFIDYAKAFDCVHHNKLWKILIEMGIPDYLTCLLINLYADQEATVRTGHETIDLFIIRKGMHQDCIFSPCLFNLNEEYIMWNAGLDES